MFGATVDLAVSGTISEAAGGSVTSPVFLGSAGAATLDGANNLVGTLGAFASGGGFVLVDGEALTVAGPVTDGTSMR